MKWISVEDELPKQHVPVLCYCFEDYEQRGYFTETMSYDDGPVHLFRGDHDGYLSVTHWMPLPPGPGETDDA